MESFGLKPDGTPLGDGRHVYEYDRGRKHRLRSFNDCIEGAAANIISEFVYKVDERRNWTERLEYVRFGGDTRPTERMTTRKLTYYP